MASGTSQGQGPPDPPDSPVALAITAIASRASSPFLSSCNKFILNTVATAKNPVATAKIIFFFILINLIISNCRPYYQLTFSFNADLPCSSIGAKELRLFPMLLTTLLYLKFFSSLSLFLLLRKSPLLPDRHGNYTSVRLRAIRSLPGNAPCGVDNNGY
jgi:hypothetical protein